jgi:DNA polymerase III epsilon subunit-like protein
LISWAAKWGDEKKVMSSALTGDEARAQDDERIVIELAALIREADVIIAHNIDKFDVPMFNNRLLLLGLENLGPVETIDTLKLSKANFRLAYNKLDYLAEKLGFGRKIKTDFDLWLAAYHGDEVALGQMLRYNRKDVVLLEQVFEALRPYVKNLKRLVEAAWDGQIACPNCGAEDYQRRGERRTQVSTFVQFQCNQCKRYFRSRKSENKKLGVVPV